MTAIDHGIEMLVKLVESLTRQGKTLAAGRTTAELSGWVEVRAGLPANETKWHHANERYAYRVGRADAEAAARFTAMMQQKEQP